MRTPEIQKEIERLEKEIEHKKAEVIALQTRLDILNVKNPINPDKETLQAIVNINKNLPKRRTDRSNRSLIG